MRDANDVFMQRDDVCESRLHAQHHAHMTSECTGAGCISTGGNTGVRGRGGSGRQHMGGTFSSARILANCMAIAFLLTLTDMIRAPLCWYPPNDIGLLREKQTVGGARTLFTGTMTSDVDWCACRGAAAAAQPIRRRQQGRAGHREVQRKPASYTPAALHAAICSSEREQAGLAEPAATCCCTAHTVHTTASALGISGLGIITATL